MGGAGGAIPGVCRGDMWMKSSDFEAISEGRERRTSATTHGARVSSIPWTSRHLDEAEPCRRQRSGTGLKDQRHARREGLHTQDSRISRKELISRFARMARAGSWQGLHIQDPRLTGGVDLKNCADCAHEHAAGKDCTLKTPESHGRS